VTVTELAQHDDGTGVLDLVDAHHVATAGAKASSLARAARAGLPVLPGFVLTPAAAAAFARGDAPDATVERARAAWQALTGDGSRAVVVRSSATTEDSLSSSMAGQFTSVLDVSGWERFRAAVRQVVASAAAVGPRGTAMAVLVQPQLQPIAGGVAFGADPVTGRRDRIVVAAVVGGPDPLVKGEDPGVQLVLSRRGRLVHSSAPFAPLAPRRPRRELARLVARAAQHFGHPQDIEWALHDDHVVLLQSRPITTLAGAGRAHGPVYGPAPLAETFPDPLTRLERDLWVEPLVDAARTVLPLLGTAPRRQVAARPLVVTPGGRVAADLALFGAEARPRGGRALLARLDPRAPLRHLGAAWRIGRLRVALPHLARDVVRDADRLLREVPAPRRLGDGELLTLLHRAREALVGLHGYEMLAGQLLTTEVTFSGAGEALRVLQLARHDDPDAPDATLVARSPVLLALSAPRIGREEQLPPTGAGPLDAPRDVPDAAVLREALRLRVRWVQELLARAAVELGHRLAATGALDRPTDVRSVPLADLGPLLRGERGLAAPLGDHLDDTPLPARFRLTKAGVVVDASPPADGRSRSTGVPAGGGRASGTVVPADALPAEGAVLVVRTLDPALAPLVRGLAALVAETGSPLSHLAILAREYGVATVVGVADASRRFPPDTRLLVDGTSGEVRVLTGDAAGER
jgi:pyruvate,water dikinase